MRKGTHRLADCVRGWRGGEGARVVLWDRVGVCGLQVSQSGTRVSSLLQPNGKRITSTTAASLAEQLFNSGCPAVGMERTKGALPPPGKRRAVTASLPVNCFSPVRAAGFFGWSGWLARIPWEYWQ